MKLNSNKIASSNKIQFKQVEYHAVVSFFTKSSQQFVLDQPIADSCYSPPGLTFDKGLHRTLERFDPGSEDVFRKDKHGQNVEQQQQHLQ